MISHYTVAMDFDEMVWVGHSILESSDSSNGRIWRLRRWLSCHFCSLCRKIVLNAFLDVPSTISPLSGHRAMVEINLKVYRGFTFMEPSMYHRLLSLVNESTNSMTR